MCARWQASGSLLPRGCFGHLRTSRRSSSVPLPRGTCGGAGGRAAPASSVSGVTFGHERARGGSSADVVQKTHAYSTSAVPKAARQRASKGSRGRSAEGGASALPAAPARWAWGGRT